MRFEDLLAQDGYFVYKTHGVSMEPMLRHNRDLVTIRVPVSRLKKYDVALYKRGDAYVLHRVIEDKGDHYLIRGDNTYALENVPDSAIIGVLTGFQRKGKQYDVTNRAYQRYARVWNAIFPLRAFNVRLRRLAVRIARKLGILPLLKRMLGKNSTIRIQPCFAIHQDRSCESMIDEQTLKTAQDLIYLAGCAVNDTVPDKSRVESMALQEVYALASRHMVSSAIAFALESAGFKDKQSGDAIAVAIRRNAIFDREWGAIRTKLEDAGIWYMPLKGAVLKSMYPKYGMREFSDHDILFDAKRADDMKNIMEGLGFSTEHFGTSNHDVYHKEPVCNFEMHRALFGPSYDEKLYEYYRDVEKRLLGEGYEKHLSPEDFYLYVIAHDYKHYTGGGSGLRTLLDTYVYLQKETLDIDYVSAEAEKMGMAEFEAQKRSLAQHLFSGGVLTEADHEMLEYIMSSGVYGTMQHRVDNKIHKTGNSKIRYMLSRFFVPVSKKNKNYAVYAGTYPLFYKHKILLPILPFYRTFRAMKNGKFKAEAKAIKNAKV